MAKKKINSDKIIWIDLEMTGLDVRSDKILELAAVVTDWKMGEKADLELVFKQPDALLKLKFKTKFWRDNAETARALLEQNKLGVSRTVAEERLIAFVQKQFKIKAPAGDIILAGNTIRADREFIDKYLPKFARYLHYRMLDVSSFKVLFDARYKKIFPKPETHRALDDIRGSIEELRYFMKFIEVK